MKKIKSILTILAVLTITTSCEDFLVEEQVTALGYGYYETEQGCEALVNACYNGLRLKYGEEWSYGLFNYGVDEYMKGYEWTQPYAQPEYNDYNPDLDGHDKGSYPDIGDWWALIYNAIDRCNVAYDKIPKVTNGIGILKDDIGKNKRKAEICLIRAYHYFTLVQQFGSIPFTLEPSSGLQFEWPRISVSYVYEKILDDLKFSYDNIPETQPQSEFGRVTKDAVRHFWAKVLLTRASYVADAEDDEDNYNPGGDATADLQKAALLIDEIRDGLRHSLVPNYANLFTEGAEINPEVILSVQYNDVVGLNESNGSYYKNSLHLYWFNQYDTEKGMVRNIEYGRPYRRLFLTDYAINIHNRMADSRLRKSLLEVYYCTESNVNNIPRWTKKELGFAFTNIAPDSLWAVRYADTVRVGGLKFTAATKIADSERVNVGDTAVVFLLNDENTTLTDRQMVAAGYKIYARYYWGTNADGTLIELVTFDRNNDLLNISNRKAADSISITSAWNRDKAPSLIKYWDRTKPGGFNASWGTRDVFIARLAESYLIGAEAYGRLGDYQKAAAYINIVRKRAAYKAGEDKGSFWLKFDGGSSETKTISTENDMLIDAFYWDTDIHNDAEMYPEGVNTQQDRFIHFILNEKCREMLGEMVRWEDLKRTGTLTSRAYAFNDDVRNSATLEKFHRLRPFPQVHLNSIQTNGRFLTPSEKNDYQNKGY